MCKTLIKPHQHWLFTFTWIKCDISFPFHFFIKHLICTSDCVEVIYPKIQHCKSETPWGAQTRARVWSPPPAPGLAVCIGDWRLEGDCDAGDTPTILAGHFTPSYTVTLNIDISPKQISINGPAEAWSKWSKGVAQWLNGSHPFVLPLGHHTLGPGVSQHSVFVTPWEAWSHDPTHPVTASINPGKGQPRRQSVLELQTKLHKV